MRFKPPKSAARLPPPHRLPAARARAGNVATKQFGIGHEIGVLDARIAIYLLRLALFGAIFFVTFLAAFLGAACFAFRL